MSLGLDEYIKRYKPTSEAMDIVEDIFKQGDGRYSNPWDHITVAGFIAHDAISINTKVIKEPQEGKIPEHKGPQQDLKRIAAWLLKERGFDIKGCEVREYGSIVDIVGIKGENKILVECGPCRINKAIDYLELSNTILWILARGPKGVVLHEITRGKNWNKFMEYRKQEKDSILEKARKIMDDVFGNLQMKAEKSGPSILTPEEIATMIKVSEKNRRDNMLLKCMYFLGLTSSEIQHLRIDDIDLENRTATVRRGEKKKIRTVNIPLGFAEELRIFMGGRRKGPLFSGRSRGLLSDRHIRRIVKTYARAANIRSWPSIRPHSLYKAHRRHLFG